MKQKVIFKVQSEFTVCELYDFFLMIFIQSQVQFYCMRVTWNKM